MKMWNTSFVVFVTFTIFSISSVYCKEQFSQVAGDKEFSLSQDAKSLRDAIVGLGTDENTIVSILTNRTNAQRQKIARFYQQQFDKNLVKDLSNDLSGTLKRIVKAMMMEPTELLAKSLHDCINRILPDDSCVISILCTRTRYELIPIIDKYLFMFNKTLLSDIDASTDGEYKVFMKTLLTPMMRDVGHVNSTVVQQKVKLIPSKPDDCDTTKSNNHALLMMMAKDSFEQIRFIIFEHESKHNTSISEAITANCQDDTLAKAYKTIINYAKNPAAYYAQIIKKSTAGLGTNDDTLIRTIVSRQEIDLAEIKQAYKQMYHTTLTSAVASETSGYYKKTLMALIGPE
ncbi:annexin B10 isoform X2 [Nilaparvata lugens]|uniref:annexin B10 isoform X2 n=1 Tax=Nilaparvata lugens TaxID=108931 RepID=UPI00193E8282|nr:annexin B10 isoform X2 [Nilaparvata lugens]